ncbi:MAG: hypothetical protein JWM78_3689 [Verrucomicrobiaceae bacterium]|nr:hypothetical protein [Verrucomicrobiaceae bacterium]
MSEATGVIAATAQWEKFCDGIKSAGVDILATAADADEATLAEGLRYLTRLMRSGIERHVEYWDPLDPFLAGTYNERLKWGLDNPDSIYLMSAVDGRYEYEIVGNVGAVPYFNLTSSTTTTDARHIRTGFLDGTAVVTDAEGNFVIHVGGAERAQNWLKLAPDSNTIMLRETYGDRAAERELTCRIHLLTDVGPDQPLKLSDVLPRIAGAEGFVVKTGKTFLQLADMMAAGVNKLPAVDDALMQKLGGDPNYFYYWSGYDLKPGEALLLQLPEVPTCENWGLCLYNRWLESLDYSRGTININKYTSKPNSDGSVTIVVSNTPPSGGNWLNTQNHLQGNMMFRWTAAEKNVAPQTKLVQLAGIDWPSVLRRWEN